MRNIDSRIEAGSFVLLDCKEIWHEVSEVADHRKHLKVKGLADSFQSSHILKFTNKRENTLTSYSKKLKKIVENLTGINGLWPNSDSVFGACHAYNTSFTRLDSNAGAVVLVEENSTNWEIDNYHVFESHEEYVEWFNNQLNNYGKGRQLYYGDCSLAYRAAINLGWVVEDEY